MRYALMHPVRTARWWRYRVHYALAERRRALAALRSERRARRALASASAEEAKPIVDRGEVVGRTFLGHDGETRELPREEAPGDWFERRSPLALEDPERRYAWR